MELATTYIVRVLERDKWEEWRTYDSLVNALDAIDDENRSNPVVGREWQVCERSTALPSARTWEHA